MCRERLLTLTRNDQGGYPQGEPISFHVLRPGRVTSTQALGAVKLSSAFFHTNILQYNKLTRHAWFQLKERNGSR